MKRTCLHSKWSPIPLTALVFCLVFTAIPLRAQTPYTGMVSFGDSLSDGGNLNYLISELFPEQIAQNLTGWDPNYYYDYRFSNGPIWVDYLYDNLGFGSMQPNDGVNYRNGTNFAWAGSRSGTGAYNTFFPNLLTQIGNYSDQISWNPALPDPATTLFTVWSGANDVFAYVEKGDPITPNQVAGNIATALTALHDDGGRFFLVPNLPPIGLIPSYLNDPIKGDLATAFVDIFNEQLEVELDALRTSLEDITIFEVDIHELFLSIMADPEAFGFTNVTDTAYIRYDEEPYPLREPPYGELAIDGSGYFYWDAAHGTTAANALIAQTAYAAMVPEPSTLLYLFTAGLGVIALRRKPFSRKPSMFGNPK